MIEATDSSFEQEVVNSELPVLVDFWAPWCGPCKMMTPSFEAVAAEFEGKVKFVKVNVDDCIGVATKYGIRGVPTIMSFNAGALLKTSTGNRPKSQITALAAELAPEEKNDVQDV